jgi:hypothetical protein
MNYAPRLRETALLVLTWCLLCQFLNGDQGRTLDNQWLTMTIVPGWTKSSSADQRVNVRHGKYLLSIDPIFTHASGIEGGRFPEIAGGIASVEAVMRNVDQPASGDECSVSRPHLLVVNATISLDSLYTDSSKTQNGCVFPAGGQSVWFGSFFSGKSEKSEYTISLGYETGDVNALPRIGSPALKQVFAEVRAMLKTLVLKPPIVISKIDPHSAAPDGQVTIRGSGFTIPGFHIAPQFAELPNLQLPNLEIAPDGTSLVFQVPSSIQTISCEEGHVEVGEQCVPVPASHVDVNDCPRIGTDVNFCGVPIPPATYHLSVIAEEGSVSADPVPFTVTAPKPRSVLITLLYPNSFVSSGNTITIRGSGFTSTGNTIRIGSTVVSDVPCADGQSLTFLAPRQPEASSFRGVKSYEAIVSNINGESNSITFTYR